MACIFMKSNVFLFFPWAFWGYILETLPNLWSVKLKSILHILVIALCFQCILNRVKLVYYFACEYQVVSALLAEETILSLSYD